MKLGLSPGSILLASVMYQDAQLGLKDDQPGFPLTFVGLEKPESAVGSELQYLFRSRRVDLVTGVGYFNIDGRLDSTLEIDPELIPPPDNVITDTASTDLKHVNLYAYANIKLSEPFTMIVGASCALLVGDSPDVGEQDQFNPKFGFIWKPSSGTTLRGAAFRAVKRTLITNQTLEPTQVAGFNQFFDDLNGTRVWRYGGAIDQRFGNAVSGGVEYSTRDLEVGGITTGEQTTERQDANERLLRAYLFLSAHPRLALSVKRYPDLYASGILDERKGTLEALAARCTLCPRECKVNRLAGERGVCGAGSELVISKALPHFGEEPVLSGTRGSGTIFFTHCNLSCMFCQNYQISQEQLGTPANDETLAEAMITLQVRGCHNINFVSATHFLPMIIRALSSAAARGLTLPLVYNSNGYERPEVLRLLEGIIDIYLPDANYGDDRQAQELSRARDYTRHNSAALKEMHRQVGSSLEIDAEGTAVRGIIVRHLVLPCDCAATDAVLQMIRDHLGTDVHLSLMGQYFPAYRAHTCKRINRKLTREEYRRSLDLLDRYGFENGWCQDPEEIEDRFVPDFSKKASWN